MKQLNDLTAPAEVVRVQLEADLQKQCVDWIRRRGWWARKFSSISQRSVPDYIFSKFLVDVVLVGVDKKGSMTPVRIKFYTEFKKPGTKPKLIAKHGVVVMSTEAQYEEQQAMLQAGWIGFECDDFEKFKREVERMELTLGRFDA